MGYNDNVRAYRQAVAPQFALIKKEISRFLWTGGRLLLFIAVCTLHNANDLADYKDKRENFHYAHRLNPLSRVRIDRLPLFYVCPCAYYNTRGVICQGKFFRGGGEASDNGHDNIFLREKQAVLEKIVEMHKKFRRGDTAVV